MNSETMKEPTKAELTEYARELESLVVDMYGLIEEQIELTDHNGHLKRHVLLKGIPSRMVALGFTGTCEEVER